jgi:hypothetical protein
MRAMLRVLVEASLLDRNRTPKALTTCFVSRDLQQPTLESDRASTCLGTRIFRAGVGFWLNLGAKD